ATVDACNSTWETEVEACGPSCSTSADCLGCVQGCIEKLGYYPDCLSKTPFWGPYPNAVYSPTPDGFNTSVTIRFGGKLYFYDGAPPDPSLTPKPFPGSQ